MVLRPVLVSGVVHALVAIGTLAMSAGFLLVSPGIQQFAMLFLGTGFTLFVCTMGLALWRSKVSNNTISAMWLAIISLLVTVVLGLVLLDAIASGNASINLLMLTNIHLGWGILGWTGLLLVGVAYQVVPMFQLTPKYPNWMVRLLGFTLFFGLIVWSALYWFGESVPSIYTGNLMLICTLGFFAFAVVTLRLQFRRKRRAVDTTVYFWWVGMGSVVVATGLWAAGLLNSGLSSAPEFPFLLGVLMFAGFAVSVINGMLYKIVPFLVWFHLQHRKMALRRDLRMPIPNIRQIIPVSPTRHQFFIHVMACILMLVAICIPGWLIYPAGLVLSASFLYLWINLLGALRVYLQFSETLDRPSTDAGQSA